MLDSVSNARPAIVAYLATYPTVPVPSMDDEEWFILRRGADCLCPYRLATTELSSDELPTSAIIYPLIGPLLYPTIDDDDDDPPIVCHC
jgi:hypothetical protein